ncbi:hypothetical protein RI578_40925 (plasmid) [Streptomyces sp. BB1-1-1]|uniref:hypothetical protein n=1 Tax=Streptomyces TaxID=1883 RepID=UPI0005DA7BE7|nr:MULTISPECIES: hypothetical protein [unclassified Streptomyces]OLO26005.1 hypothetical protein PZ61_0237130 [Streptomyces sp. MNU77]WND40657.1 hypothetical protein RI578_40925 [Streptomyces sp. BB1-1-1]
MSEDFRPRTVQHRRCQPLHTVYGLVALLAGCGVLVEQPVMWLFVVPVAVLVLETRRLARHRACAVLRRRDERKVAPARAHWVWGAAAAVLDTALVAGAFAVCTVLLLGHGEALVLRGRAADYLALGAGAVFAGAHALTHRMSARAPKAPRPEA